MSRDLSNILTDEELRSLTEDVPFAEGDSLEAFLKEAAHVMEAVGNDGTDFGCLEYRARLVYLFRAFYFLGVLRGGEAYRWALASEAEADNEDAAAFQLDAACADLFVSELACAGPDKLRPVYDLLKL